MGNRVRRNMSIKARLLAFFIIAVAVVSTNVYAFKLEPISYSKSQSETAKDMLKKLQSQHYREIVIDDQLSRNYLDRYLKTLDPSHMFFYDKDVHSFATYKNSFDDYFKSGDLSAAYKIYDLYRQRVASRMESVQELLIDSTVVFNFEEHDDVLLNRENEPWPSSLTEADKLWFKRVKLSLLNLKMTGKTLEEAKDVVIKRYKRQLKRVQQEDSADVFETIANALATLYDPHTNYWSPRTSKNFDINMSLSLEGIGAVLQSDDEFTKVVRLVAGGPADKQGQLKAADRIIAVAQGDAGELIDVVGWRLEEVVDLIRGPKNTVVKLEVSKADAGAQKNRLIRINRGEVKLEDQAAQKEVLELSDGTKTYKLGVIYLPTFYVDFEAQRNRESNFKSSSSDVAKLLRELLKENIDGLILDLRNNGGGSLQEAVNLTDLFIDQGPVVQIRSPDNRIDRHNRSRFKALYTGPLVVMVNRLSASASEIFAGAIQDYGRGMIVGSQTFGKGTVQSVNRLLEGGVKITESKFYRVSGDSTQHRGVLPDISFPQLIDTEEVGESAYDSALPWDQIHSVPHVEYFNFASMLPLLQSLHEKRALHDPDYTYMLDQIEIMKQNKEQKTISLNETTRKKEKRKIELQAMTIENKRLAAKKIPTFKDLKAFRASEKEDEEKNELASPSEQQKIDVDGDALLVETGSILVDTIRLSNKPEVQQAFNYSPSSSKVEY